MKKVLVLNFFPALRPPKSGGDLRYYNFYEKLSDYFDITLLSPTFNESKVEQINHKLTFREYRVPKEDIHNQIHWKLEQENFSPEFSALTCAYSGELLNNYHYHYLKLYRSADIIIHDNPYMIHYDLFWGCDNKPRVYNSYNLEYELLSQIYSGDNAKKHLDYVYNIEKKMVLEADLVLAISDLEKNKFISLYGCNKNKIKLAPNGINPEDLSIRSEITSNTAFFIGSGHPPNIEAVNFIINCLADKCRHIDFLIAGSCCKGIESSKQNVKLLGMVDESEKQSLFRTSDVAINPMFSGAGTNLKTLEYLSMGIPMISTDVGVRGIKLINNEHCVIASSDEFAKKLTYLINNKTLKEKISEKSKSYINNMFNWKNIAKYAYEEIARIKDKRKKTILLLNDFEVSNPSNGGEVRINKIYNEISKTYNVLLLCLNSQNYLKKTWINNSFLEISFPKTLEHLKEEEKVNSKHWVSASDIVCSYMIQKNEIYTTAVQAFSSIADTTIVCHPYMINTVSECNNNYLIHESLNYEYGLKKELLTDHPLSDKLIKQTKKVESESCIKSNLIISVSDDDHKGLHAYLNSDITNEIITVKNGVEIVENKFHISSLTNVKEMFRGKTTVLFIGSSHMPNIESLRYIVEKLASDLQECYFLIIGSVCDAIDNLSVPSNVLLFGKLDGMYKNFIFNICDIAINPILGGSGSNLKLADYFASKLPTITTPFGARGYDIDESNAIICELNQFSANIKKLQNDKALSSMLSLNGFNYAKENVEWTILGKKFRDLLDYKLFGKNRKELLIVTYRFTLPPLGGAEVYMYELIKGLDLLDCFDITVAYIDSYKIENRHHFSTKITKNLSKLEHNFKNVNFERFSYNELSDCSSLDNSRVLMKTWLDEHIESARKFVDLYNDIMLMGGWNFPEKIKNGVQIWTSKASEIYINEKCKDIFIKGFSPSEKEVYLRLNNDLLDAKKVSGFFEIRIKTDKKGVLSITTAEDILGEDARPLGLLINSIKCDDTYVDLDYCYRNYLKDNYLSKYIDEIISVASGREEDIDNLFQKTRGINSSELEQYLDSNIRRFDFVLGHSVPFTTSVLTGKYAKKHNIKYALLPHFHFDDEYYHWNSYYQSMKNADIVFASPTVSLDMFYNKINAKTVEVPGGGIDRCEYENVDSEKFKQLYNSDKPFLLVLGRKSGAKNYSLIVDAVDSINKKNHVCNLVIIGRDEDGVSIDSKYTIYLKEQPREIVLGALNSCSGLVNMSDSESFGIVIIEAWMLSKPVIVNENCPAFRELVTDNYNGFFANKTNLEVIIWKLLLLSDVDRSTLGLNGYKKTSDYLWSTISDKINSSIVNLC